MGCQCLSKGAQRRTVAPSPAIGKSDGASALAALGRAQHIGIHAKMLPALAIFSPARPRGLRVRCGVHRKLGRRFGSRRASLLHSPRGRTVDVS